MIKDEEISLRNQTNGFDEQELCDSIQKNGLLTPIIVRYTGDDKFEVICGKRRLDAFKKIGLRKILCHIIEADDKKAFEISLIENIHNKKINPIEEAFAFKKYTSNFGWGGITDLAKKISKSISYVDRRIKLLELDDNLKKEIIAGNFKTSIADELLTIKDTSSQSVLTDLIRKRQPTLREFRRIVKEDAPKNSQLDDSVFDKNNETSKIIKTIDVDKKAQRSFDQAIMAIRFSMDKISSIINNNKDNWTLYEIFMQHKQVLHEQIDILYKEKKKIPLMIVMGLSLYISVFSDFLDVI